MDMTTRTQVTDAVNNYYDKRLLEKAKPAFNYMRFAQVRDISQNSSDTIKFRRYTLLTAPTTALSEGVTPSGSQLAITDVTADVLQYGDFVTLTDKLLFTTQDPVMQETTDLLATQAADCLDKLTRAILIAGTTIQYAGAASSNGTITSSMKLTKAEVQEAVRTLKGQNAKKITSMIDPSDKFNTTPIPACYVGFVHPNSVYDLKQIAGFIPVEQYGQKTAMPNEVGSVDEVRFIESTNAYYNASAGAGSIDVYYTVIIGADAYGISRVQGEALKTITKPLGSAGSADPLDQRQTMGWKASFVATVLNENFMINVRHAVSS